MTVPVYLINLDRSADRLATMVKRFAAVGVKFQRVAGVDGQILSAAELEAIREPRRAWRLLNAGETGCFLGHRRCWELIANGDAAFGCVFEDDVHLSPRLARFLQNAAEIPPHADVVKLDTSHLRIWLDRKRLSVGGTGIARLRGPHYGAGGYMVSRSAAARLLALTDRVSLPIDVVLYDPMIGLAGEFTLYQTLPSLCDHPCYVQGPEGVALSTIDGIRSDWIDGRLSRRLRRYTVKSRHLWHRLCRHRRELVHFDGVISPGV